MIASQALEQYGAQLAQSLADVLNDYVSVELSSVDMLLYQELLRTVPEPCFYAELCSGDGAMSLVEAAPSLAAKLVASVLGVALVDPRDPEVLVAWAPTSENGDDATDRAELVGMLRERIEG